MHDCVVVGDGSAGCILANRIRVDPSVNAFFDGHCPISMRLMVKLVPDK